VQNKHASGQSNRINGAACIPLTIFDDFQHSRRTKTFERLGLFMLAAGRAK